MKKTILLTGSSRGIGLVITNRLLDEGHVVVGLARSHTISHKNYIPKKIDLGDIKSLSDHLNALTKEFSNVDGLICNAGIWHHGVFAEMTLNEIQQIIEVNFLSHVFLVKAFLPQMEKQKNGDIFFIGSSAGLKGPPKQSIYAASKGALRTFAQSLRSECIPKNIRVTILNPGNVQANASKSNHFLAPEDIAGVISYLLTSELGTFVNEINLSSEK